jgi:L-lactate dehydrogenase complex protein LldG
VSARDVVLERIRAALGDGAASAPAIPRAYAVASGLDHAGQVDRFAERCAEYRATVVRCAEKDVAATVGAILARHGAARLVMPADLPTAWRPDGITWLQDPLDAHALDDADGVVTGSALAIADTGTIVLDGGPRQGRRALTLLPDLHVCVVRARDVVGTVPEAVRALTGGVRDARRAVTFVSGPSATSDIELDRVEGVHGPRRLEVVVVDDPTPDARPEGEA